jgi:hypothetical protein
VAVPLVLEPFMQALQYIHSKVGWRPWPRRLLCCAWRAGTDQQCHAWPPLRPCPRASCTATSSRRTSC